MNSIQFQHNFQLSFSFEIGNGAKNVHRKASHIGVKWYSKGGAFIDGDSASRQKFCSLNFGIISVFEYIATHYAFA